MSDQGKAWPPNTPGAREAEDDIQQKTPIQENNIQGLGEQMHSTVMGNFREAVKFPICLGP